MLGNRQTVADSVIVSMSRETDEATAAQRTARAARRAGVSPSAVFDDMLRVGCDEHVARQAIGAAFNIPASARLEAEDAHVKAIGLFRQGLCSGQIQRELCFVGFQENLAKQTVRTVFADYKESLFGGTTTGGASSNRDFQAQRAASIAFFKAMGRQSITLLCADCARVTGTMKTALADSFVEHGWKCAPCSRLEINRIQAARDAVDAKRAFQIHVVRRTEGGRPFEERDVAIDLQSHGTAQALIERILGHGLVAIDREEFLAALKGESAASGPVRSEHGILIHDVRLRIVRNLTDRINIREYVFAPAINLSPNQWSAVFDEAPGFELVRANSSVIVIRRTLTPTGLLSWEDVEPKIVTLLHLAVPIGMFEKGAA